MPYGDPMSHLPFDGLSSTEFERFCLRLLEGLGFKNTEWRKGAVGDYSPADGGYDLEMMLTRHDPDGWEYQETWFVECKQRKKALSFNEISSLLSLGEEADVLLLMLDGHISRQAREKLGQWQNRHPQTRLRIWERHNLEDLCTQEKSRAFDSNGTPFSDFLVTSSRVRSQDLIVRRAALAALERIGIAHPNFRQPVVDTVCQYLRAPAEAHDQDVRRFAQSILQRWLTGLDDRLEPVADDEIWQDIDLDLTGAHLVDFRFVSGRATQAIFKDVHFAGVTRFGNTTFRHHADFSGSAFHDSADFTSCTFAHSADFSETTFHDWSSFYSARFDGYANFSASRHIDEASFRRARFNQPASFVSAAFQKGATFERAIFEEDTFFDNTHFGEFGSFESASFQTVVSFCDSTVDGDMDFSHTTNRGRGLYRQVWPAGWSSPYRYCLAVVREEDMPDSQDSLCEDCTPTKRCFLGETEEG